MHRYDKPSHLLAISLALLAGFVDSVGFLSLGGFFVSFMSGNSTRLAVAAATLSTQTLFCGFLIAGFVLGVIMGATLGRISKHWRLQAVLALVSALLMLGAGLASLATTLYLPALMMTTAMGAINNVFQRKGEVSVGVTYMTGALVKLGQHIASALAGGPAMAWLPYFLLWAGLVCGAIGGALGFAVAGLQALWFAALYATGLTLYTTVFVKPVVRQRRRA